MNRTVTTAEQQQQELNEIGLTPGFIERWGADCMALKDLIDRMAAEGAIDDLNTMIKIFSACIVSAGGVLGREAAATINMAMIPPTNWSAC